MIIVDGRFYVPFAPFPAIALMPIVALLGPVTADQVESGINAVLAAAGVGMCWWLLGRIGVRAWSTGSGWRSCSGSRPRSCGSTTRGGVWHTGHLIATILTFACLIELWGRRRAWLIGLLAGAAFLTRAPLAFAIPFYALLLPRPACRPRTHRRGVAGPGSAVWASLPSLVVFFAYNQVRFGTPFESGYALATLPEFLERQRALGLFSLAHVPMNLDYFLFHLPSVIPEFPFFRPDGLGLSVLITSPGLLFASPRRLARPRAWWLLGAALARPHPDAPLLRRRLAAVRLPLLPRLGAVRHRAVRARPRSIRGRIGLGWRVLIAFGVVVMAMGAYWAHEI